MTRRIKTNAMSGLALGVGLVFAVACGSKSKPPTVVGGGTGGGGDDITGGGKLGGGAKPKVPERKVSKTSTKAFKAAVALWKQKAKEGWTEANCRAVGDKFANVADDNNKLVEAHFNAGLAYHKCGMDDEAAKHYNRALKVMPNHPGALSSLGEIAYRRGQVDQARNMWQRALKLDGKLIGARNNLAYLSLQQLRRTKNRDAWNKIAKELEFNLSSSLAVDNDNVRTYTLYGLYYLEGSERNRSRLDLAKLLFDEGSKRNESFAPLHNALGLYHLKRNSLGVALSSFMKAVSLDPNFTEARMNVGNMSLGFRKYDTAEQMFSEVLKRQPKNYTATIGLGVAQRGLGKISEAEESYKKAMKLDSGRGEAYFNMAVLFKDFRASKETQVDKVISLYNTSLKYFKEYLTKRNVTKAAREETDESVEKINKTLKSLYQVKKALEQSKKK